MPPPQWITDNIPTLLRPSILLSMSAYHFIMTVYEVAIAELKPWKIFDITSLRFRAFARLWKDKGAEMSAEMPGRTFELLSQCSGVVLDIGPGSGEMLSRFDSSRIAAIYGPEPAADLHAGLMKNAQRAGFGNKYHALLCGAEPESLIPALYKSGILAQSGTGGTAEEGVFDEICCVRVLCGVPRPKETIRGLFALLKPGGRVVVCEHVVNPWRSEGSIMARFMQIVYTILGWPFFMGGCELQRHTETFLKDAGEWEKFELEYVGPKDAIPFLVGELIKKR